MGWGRSALVAAALLAFATGNATAAEPKRVLLLHSFGADFQAEDTFADYLRTDLAEKSTYPIDRFEVSLEIARFTEGERDEAFVSYLRAVFADHPPDLIVTMISPAARFIQRHRRDLFPSTPVIFAALDARAINVATLTAKDAMVAVSIDLTAVVENILRTLPNTTTLAVVMGDAPIEKFWVKEFLLAFRPFEGRVKSVFMNDLSFGEIQKQVAALPPATPRFISATSSSTRRAFPIDRRRFSPGCMRSPTHRYSDGSITSWARALWGGHSSLFTP